MEGPGEEIPVVIEMESECCVVGRVLERKQSGWVDVSQDVAWVEPNFDFARGRQA
jgi:hypothetical protein